jgi:uncharacterized protein
LRQLGDAKAVLLVGFLHGLWHLPLALLTPFYLAEGNRLFTIPIFLGLMTAAGVMYGVLRLATGSVWPSTILHATFNVLLGSFAALTVVRSPVGGYLAGESGLILLAAAAAVALWFARRYPAPDQPIWR